MLDRLPYEIFSKIIKLSYRYSFNSGHNFGDDETSLPPFEATRVCRAWRNTLLRDPTMWTTIRLNYTESNPDELTETISRSGSRPLDVFIEEGDHPIPSDDPELIFIVLEGWVLPEMHRVRTFQALLPPSMAGTVLDVLKEPAPMLQRFHFEFDGGGETQMRRGWLTLGEVFDHALPFDDAPNLKYIYIPISLGLTEFQSISFFRSLSIIHLQFISYTDIEGDILLDILQHSSPCLRVLNLIWSRVEPNITCSMPSHCRISLPRLQELSLQGTCTADNINFVLKRLDFPVDKVNLDINCVDFYPAPYWLATSLIDFQRRLLLLSISESSTEYMSAINFSKQTSEMNMESPTSNLYSSGNPIFRTLLRQSLPRRYLVDLFPNNTGMTNITHVCLEDYLMDITMLRKLLESLPNAQYFRIYHGSRHEGLQARSGRLSDSYLKALIPSRWDQIQGRSQVHLLPCPSLHTLQLVFRGNFLEFDLYYITALIGCFLFREEVGHPLKSIIIWHENSSLIKRFSEAWLQIQDFEGLRDAVEFRVVND